MPSFSAVSASGKIRVVFIVLFLGIMHTELSMGFAVSQA
jgi:hypothetical protein